MFGFKQQSYEFTEQGPFANIIRERFNVVGSTISLYCFFSFLLRASVLGRFSKGSTQATEAAQVMEYCQYQPIHKTRAHQSQSG